LALKTENLDLSPYLDKESFKMRFDGTFDERSSSKTKVAPFGYLCLFDRNGLHSERNTA
jgi:hypothetical protein